MIRFDLSACAEPQYRDFAMRLIPGCTNMLGVRLPVLRKLARQIAKADYRAYLGSASDDTFEDVMLQGMVIGYICADLEEIMPFVRGFVPKIDNWSVCDSFCAGLKIVKGHRERMLAFLTPYLKGGEFEKRFAAVMLLTYYTDEDFLPRTLEILQKIDTAEVYARLGVAWAVSVCYVKNPERTRCLLMQDDLDEETRMLAIRKIRESNAVSQEDKAAVLLR